MVNIFLSHNHRDKPFARKLSERLQSYGIRTWLDEAEMQVGDSLISKIETAIRECTYLGVILSPSSTSSEWVRREVNIAVTEEIQGRRVKVIPILYKKCDVPGFIADKIYADFTQDFEEGFEKLLARLTNELREERHKQKRAYEILQVAYQDWNSFEKQDYYLLNREQINLVLQHVVQPNFSSELLTYIFCSISYVPDSKESEISQLKAWLHKLGTIDVIDLFNRILEHPNSQVRLGAIKLIQRLEEKNVINVLIAKIKDERVRDIKRAILECISTLGGHLSPELAQSLLDTEEDWIIQSYALKNLDKYRAVLLISDGTEFAIELGTIAQEARFRLVSYPISLFYLETEMPNDEILISYDLIILVRGEHLRAYGNEHFYSQLRKFVFAGGSLFATSWVSWENQYHKEFATVLPFAHIQNKYIEDVMITCMSTASQLAKRLFPKKMSFRTSFELLQNKDGSVVLLETDNHTPIFGYRHFGSGLCYYLNSCQHSCLGTILSPMQTSSELHDSLKQVFEWIFNTRAREEVK